MARTTAAAPGAAEPAPPSRLDRVLDTVERVGNRLPDPFMLFVYIFAALAVISTVVAAFGASVRVPGTPEDLPVRAVLSGEGIVYFLQNFVKNFIEFPPLGNVVTMLIAVAVAERSGFLKAAITALFARIPRGLLPYGVALVATQGHVMSDPSMIVIPPLAGLVFKAAGRHPVAGLIGAFACNTAGYSSGILLGSLDALLVGITEKAAAIIPNNPATPVNITSNYYFSAASGLILPFVGGWVIDRLVEPRLGPYRDVEEDESAARLDDRQRRGLLIAVGALAVYVVIVFTAWLLPGSPLRGQGGALVPSPFLNSILPLLIFAFLLSGLTYGVVTRTIRSTRDVPRMMAETVRDLAGYIVFIFAAAQVIALFTWTNLGALIAVRSAEFLQAIGLTGFLAIVALVAITSVLNLFITSGSAMWSLLAPVMIPAFLLLGYEPAFIQAAYRIGDSTTQVITPLNPYLVVLLGYVRTYQPETQLGGILARLAVFVAPFWVVWMAILAIFFFLDLPVGPGVGVYIPGQ